MFSYVNCLQYANTKQMVQITAVYTMDLIWIQVVPNLTVVASTFTVEVGKNYGE